MRCSALLCVACAAALPLQERRTGMEHPLPHMPAEMMTAGDSLHGAQQESLSLGSMSVLTEIQTGLQELKAELRDEVRGSRTAVLGAIAQLARNGRDSMGHLPWSRQPLNLIEGGPDSSREPPPGKAVAAGPARSLRETPPRLQDVAAVMRADLRDMKAQLRDEVRDLKTQMLEAVLKLHLLSLETPTAVIFGADGSSW